MLSESLRSTVMQEAVIRAYENHPDADDGDIAELIFLEYTEEIERLQQSQSAILDIYKEPDDTKLGDMPIINRGVSPEEAPEEEPEEEDDDNN